MQSNMVFAVQCSDLGTAGISTRINWGCETSTNVGNYRC
jgi:hypothetical protein